MRYDQLTTGLRLCDGTRKGYRLACRGTLYTCAACGHSGCRQTQPDACSQQGLDAHGRCLKCGAVGAEAVPA